MNALRMFAGPMAKTADHQALARAQEMAGQGATRDAIWRDTGWFQGVDGKWRFEIDDSGANLTPRVAEQFEGGKPIYTNMQGGFDHPTLYGSYAEDAPFMGDLNVMRTRGNRSAGTYRDATDELTIVAPTVAEARSGILHEAQHGVQRREGFARGGTPDEFTQQSQAELARDAMAWRRELATMRQKMPQADWIAVENRVVEEYQRLGAMDMLPSREARDVARDTIGNPDEQLQAVMRRYATDTQVTPLRPREVYRRLAGETEARNVQTRRDFTPEERRSRPPWETQDVPDDQQIVRFDGDRASNALGDMLRVSAGLGGVALAGDITLRELLRERRASRSNPST